MSFPRGGCWPLGWVCLAPLFVCLDAAGPGKPAAAASFLAGWAFDAAAFFWIFGTCRYAHFSFVLSALALATLSAALAVNWTAAALIGRRIAARADLLAAVAEKLARVGIGQAVAIEEQVRSYGGPQYQLTQQVMSRFAEAIEASGVDVVPKIMLGNGDGKGGAGSTSSFVEGLLAMLLSEKLTASLGCAALGPRDPAVEALRRDIKRKTAQKA